MITESLFARGSIERSCSLFLISLYNFDGFSIFSYLLDRFIPENIMLVLLLRYELLLNFSWHRDWPFLWNRSMLLWRLIIKPWCLKISLYFFIFHYLDIMSVINGLIGIATLWLRCIFGIHVLGDGLSEDIFLNWPQVFRESNRLIGLNPRFVDEGCRVNP